jgi:UDP-N-acetylmuramyl pentapeptide phosphotransferase/UDP-N-acetylglucosamine-1-phosphate transferase
MTWAVLAGVFLTVVVVTPSAIRYFIKPRKLDKPSIRKIHNDPNPSIGGHVFVPTAFNGWWPLVPDIDSKVLTLTASAAINIYMP